MVLTGQVCKLGSRQHTDMMYLSNWTPSGPPYRRPLSPSRAVISLDESGACRNTSGSAPQMSLCIRQHCQRSSVSQRISRLGAAGSRRAASRCGQQHENWMGTHLLLAVGAAERRLMASRGKGRRVS